MAGPDCIKNHCFCKGFAKDICCSCGTRKGGDNTKTYKEQIDSLKSEIASMKLIVEKALWFKVYLIGPYTHQEVSKKKSELFEAIEDYQRTSKKD